MTFKLEAGSCSRHGVKKWLRLPSGFKSLKLFLFRCFLLLFSALRLLLALVVEGFLCYLWRYIVPATEPAVPINVVAPATFSGVLFFVYTFFLW